ncbi:MAG TPA: sodium:alanine symporter family protein [Phycisphaerales bacterium]|nr:sodium:alanine symporter family protein [Phycisphaerales bacterium]
MQAVMDALNVVNGVLWHDIVLYIVLAVGVLFTVWSGFGQYHALTHGVQVIRGKYDDKHDPGAINHFQALSTALSGTVGLGNIAGVAVAVSLGGPGAVFWMWVVAAVGMMIKSTEVTLSMLYRNTSDPENPHGGPMWVAARGFEKWGLGGVGKAVGWIFCITLIISTLTGGNMFQAWNVAKITKTYFPSVPEPAVGIVITVLVGLVIIGGIKRIGAVTGRLVPFMCVLYLLGAFYVLAMNIGEVPAMLRLIVVSALPPFLGGESAAPAGAFLGGTFGYAFLWGMKRALFSNEAGQGSSPIAHSAAKTDEPAREGIVAGLEPFIDTIVVCTLTALVVLSSGAWNREPAAVFENTPVMAAGPTPGTWVPLTVGVPAKDAAEAKVSQVWRANDEVFLLVKGALDEDTGRDLHKVNGTIVEEGDALRINWTPHASPTAPEVAGPGLHMNLTGAALTGYAFDRVQPGMGMWIVTAACWLFAVSTIISWYYYGEQGMIFMLGKKSVMPYKVLYCFFVFASTLPFIKTDQELDAFTALGTGVMLFANIPIMLIFGAQAMRSYKDYTRRLRSGQMASHAAPPITDVVEGKDVK